MIRHLLGNCHIIIVLHKLSNNFYCLQRCLLHMEIKSVLMTEPAGLQKTSSSVTMEQKLSSVDLLKPAEQNRSDQKMSRNLSDAGKDRGSLITLVVHVMVTKGSKMSQCRAVIRWEHRFNRESTYIYMLI